jgi:hypothetical protein
VDVYNVELFLHVTGVVIVFAGYGALLFATVMLRIADRTEVVRSMARLVAGRRVGFEYISVIDAVVIAGSVLLIIGGVTMAASTWGFTQGWIDVSIGMILALGPLGAFVVSPRLHRISVLAAQAPDGPLSGSLRAAIVDPFLTTILCGSTSGLIGVLFLMTNKPSLAVSVIVMIVAIGIGVVGARLWLQRAGSEPLEAFAAESAYTEVAQRLPGGDEDDK